MAAKLERHCHSVIEIKCCIMKKLTQKIDLRIVYPKPNGKYMLNDLDFDQKKKLIELLLKCPSLKNAQSRHSVLAELPPHIAQAIEASNKAKQHVLNIVNTCMNHDGGLENLIEIVRFFDKETKQFQRLTDYFIKGLIPQAPNMLSSKKDGLTDSDQTFLDQVFEKLYHEAALILLAQEYRVTLPVLSKIEKRLKNRFGVENTYRLIPLSTQHAEPAAYFSYLGQQLHLSQTVHNDADLEIALRKQLENGNIFCLFLSRLETGDGARANEFASVLRNFLETTQLHLLLCGGQKLAELKFAGGNLSLLNNAGVEEWPELTVDDVQRLYCQCYPEQSLSRKAAHALLTVSGGHPVLLQRCLEYRVHNPRAVIKNYPQWLKQETVLTAAFTQFKKKNNNTKQLCKWLAQPNVAPAQPYIFDDLLREVYWLNLLVKRNNRLVWRCEAVREAGREILSCT